MTLVADGKIRKKIYYYRPLGVTPIRPRSPLEREADKGATSHGPPAAPTAIDSHRDACLNLRRFADSEVCYDAAGVGHRPLPERGAAHPRGPRLAPRRDLPP